MAERTPYLSLDAAARRLDVGTATLSRWIREGRFPAYRTPGGRYRIVEADLVLALEPARAEGHRRRREGNA